MIVKMMSEENLPDKDFSKCFTLIETQKVEFYRKDGLLIVSCMLSHPTDKVVGGGFVTSNDRVANGNVYVMNNEGKTIETIAHMKSLKQKIIDNFKES